MSDGSELGTVGSVESLKNTSESEISGELGPWLGFGSGLATWEGLEVEFWEVMADAKKIDNPSAAKSCSVKVIVSMPSYHTLQVSVGCRSPLRGMILFFGSEYPGMHKFLHIII